MRGIALNNLYRLIHSLSHEEAEVCKTFLRAFDSRREKFEGKASVLFGEILIDKERVKTEQDHILFLYGQTGAKSAFAKLVFRLKNKVLESILLDINLERKTSFSERSRTKGTINKKFIYATVLMARSMTDMALQLLDSIIEDGGEYELWSEVVQAYKLKRQLIAVNKGRNEYNKLQNKLREAIRSKRAADKAQYEIEKLGLIINYGTWNEKYTLELRETINEIKDLQEQTQSELTEYRLSFLKATYNQKLELYSKAEKDLIRLVELTANAKPVAHKMKHALAILNLSENYLYQGNFGLCLSKTYETIKLVSSSHNTSLRAYELQFYAYFYMGEYGKAFSPLQKARNNCEEHGWDFNKGKWTYLQACLFFCVNKYEDVDLLLNEVLPIEQDKEGFNMSMRLLFIMNAIARQKLDLAIDRIENFRKRISVIKQRNGNYHRYSLIYKILNELIKNDFDFNLTKSNNIPLFKKFEEVSKCQWKILSTELIIFEQWFDCNANSQPFKQTIRFKPEPNVRLKLVV